MIGLTGIRKPDFYKSKQARLQDTLTGLAETASKLQCEDAKLQRQEEVLHQLCNQQLSVFKLLTNLTTNHTTAAEQGDDDSHSRPSHSASVTREQKNSYAAAASTQQPVISEMAATAPTTSGNYAFGLLLAATHTQHQQASTMTQQEWCTYYSALAAKLCLLDGEIQRERDHPQEHCLLPSAHARSQSTVAQFSAATAHPTNSLHCKEGLSWQQDEQQVRALVDEFYTLTLLAHVRGTELMYRRASFIDLSTGVQVQEVPASHWQEVAQAVQLTPQQVSQLKVAFQQFQRYKRALQGQQQAAVSSMIAVTQQVEQMLLNTAGHSSHSSSSQTSALTICRQVEAASATVSKHSTAASGGSVDEDGTGSTEQLLLSQLQGVLDSTSTAMVMFIMFGLNTLTHWQRTQLLMKSYPFCPRAAAFVEAALIHAEQQQQQQLLPAPQQQARPPMQPAQPLWSGAAHQHERQLTDQHTGLEALEILLAANGVPLPAEELPSQPTGQPMQRRPEHHWQLQVQNTQLTLSGSDSVQSGQQGLNQHQHHKQQQKQQQWEEEHQHQQQELLGVSVQDKMRQIAAALWQWKQAGGSMSQPALGSMSPRVPATSSW